MPGLDRVLLVPGFLGFGSFGRAGGPRIVYFDRVIRALEVARPDLRGRIDVHEPPPMGSLEARVRSLHDRLLQLLGEAALRGRGGRKRLRVHLVGHSTGGVDARLLANPRFRFKGEDPELRRRLLEHVGTVVTLSAPHHGTPIAASAVRVLYRLVLDGMSLAAILADAGKLRRSLGLPGLDFLLSFLQTSPLRPKVNGPALSLVAGMDEETALQIARFRGLVLSDGRLLRDLEPARMAALHERLSGGDAELVQLATVAPPPRLGPGALDALDRRALYALCWEGAASRRFRPLRFPEGDGWIAARPPGEARRAVGETPRANDGLVPVSSQTLHGRAARLVLADHLDVIGHFEWRWNTTLFKSGAGFGRREFTALWRFVGEAL